MFLGHWENEWFWYGKKKFESLIFLQATRQYQVWSFQFEVNNYDRERGFAEWLNKLETVCKLQKVKNL